MPPLDTSGTSWITGTPGQNDVALAKQILDSEIEEFSFVDVPATDRPFVMFKSLKHGQHDQTDHGNRGGAAGGSGDANDPKSPAMGRRFLDALHNILRAVGRDFDEGVRAEAEWAFGEENLKPQYQRKPKMLVWDERTLSYKHGDHDQSTHGHRGGLSPEDREARAIDEEVEDSIDRARTRRMREEWGPEGSKATELLSRLRSRRESSEGSDDLALNREISYNYAIAKVERATRAIGQAVDSIDSGDFEEAQKFYETAFKEIRDVGEPDLGEAILEALTDLEGKHGMKPNRAMRPWDWKPKKALGHKGGNEVAEKKAPEGADPATFERCIEDVMAEGKDKDSAYGICTAGGAGKGEEGEKAGPPFPPKQAAGPPQPQPQAPPQQPEAVNVPQTPTVVGSNEVLTKCMELGLPQDQANTVLQVIRANFGDPTDPEKILIPAGVTLEEVIQAAMQAAGAQAQPQQPQPQPGAAPPQMPAVPGKRATVTLPGHNVWAVAYRKFLGLPAEEAPGEGGDLDVNELKALVAAVESQTKKYEDLMSALKEERAANERHADRVFSLLAGAIGVDLPKKEEEAKPEPTAPVSEPEETEVPAGEPEPVGAAPVGEPPVGKAIGPVGRKSVVPDTSEKRGRAEMVYSTYLGMEIPRSDRDALRGR